MTLDGSSWATLSPDGERYRYLLGRKLSDRPGTMLFVMLNPSTADALQDDPTIRRCKGFAAREGFGILEVVNLFAYRAAKPEALRQVADPVGPRNDSHITEAVGRATTVVLAWGALRPPFQERARSVLLLIESAIWAADQLDKGPWCLGVNANGQPAHPLYIPAHRPLARWAL